MEDDQAGNAGNANESSHQSHQALPLGRPSAPAVHGVDFVRAVLWRGSFCDRGSHGSGDSHEVRRSGGMIGSSGSAPLLELTSDIMASQLNRPIQGCPTSVIDTVARGAGGEEENDSLWVRRVVQGASSLVVKRACICAI